MAEWRASLLDKGLKENAGKSKVMVGSSCGKIIVNSGKWEMSACKLCCCCCCSPFSPCSFQFGSLASR